MSGERVDLDELLVRARDALLSAHRRRGDDVDDAHMPADARWIRSPRRDDLEDVVVESSGADVFDRALEVDAKFAVAAQPAVVEALVARIRELEAACLRMYHDNVRDEDVDVQRWIDETLRNGVVLP